jgi:2'-5' RNA ligase
MSTIRTFIALPASLDNQQAMAEIQNKLKASQADVKWDLPNKFHITLKFLGNIEQTKIEPLSSAIADCVHSFSPFEIIYETLGTFPNLHNPRVVWIGIKANQLVLDLQAKVEQVCLDFGFPKENRSFHPHITLGRVKGIRNLVHLTEAIKNITFDAIQSSCSEILLMKSDLHPSGSIYTTLKSFPFQSRDAG